MCLKHAGAMMIRFWLAITLPRYCLSGRQNNWRNSIDLRKAGHSVPKWPTKSSRPRRPARSTLVIPSFIWVVRWAKSRRGRWRWRGYRQKSTRRSSWRWWRSSNRRGYVHWPPVQQGIDTRLHVAANTDLQPGGGGGGGAIGDGARGGDGGGGGEQVSALIDLVAMKAAGLDHIDVVVGKGGAVPTLPGQHSPKAADSLVRFIAKDGKILKEIRAGGGSGGKSASAYLPDDASELSLEDIQRGGFRITTFLPANSLQLHGGLVFVLGGGWVKFTLQSIPCPIAWSIL